MEEDKPYQPLSDIREVLPILNKISIFAGLTQEELGSLFRLLQKVSYEKDEYIFREGEEPSHIYIVESGAVKIIAGVEDEEYELIVFDVGHCFGETSVIGIQPHSANAVAVSNTELIVLSRDALHSIYDTDKELFSKLVLNIAREACRRLHHSDEVFLHYFADHRHS
jgi:CRP-like cAMP-binding protein